MIISINHHFHPADKVRYIRCSSLEKCAQFLIETYPQLETVDTDKLEDGIAVGEEIVTVTDDPFEHDFLMIQVQGPAVVYPLGSTLVFLQRMSHIPLACGDDYLPGLYESVVLQIEEMEGSKVLPTKEEWIGGQVAMAENSDGRSVRLYLIPIEKYE